MGHARRGRSFVEMTWQMDATLALHLLSNGFVQFQWLTNGECLMKYIAQFIALAAVAIPCVLSSQIPSSTD